MGNQAGGMTPTSSGAADDYIGSSGSTGRSPQRGRPAQVDTQRSQGPRENGIQQGQGKGVGATPRSGTASGRSLGNKKYRHYSADWVLKKNEMAPELQKNGELCCTMRS